MTYVRDFRAGWSRTERTGPRDNHPAHVYALYQWRDGNLSCDRSSRDTRQCLHPNTGPPVRIQSTFRTAAQLKNPKSKPTLLEPRCPASVADIATAKSMLSLPLTSTNANLQGCCCLPVDRPSAHFPHLPDSDLSHSSSRLQGRSALTFSNFFTDQ